MYKLWFIFYAALAVAAPSLVFGEVQPYDTYGKVVIGNFSSKAGVANVVFDHWLHRAQFTCRVCHVDIGFLMEAGGTRITAADNMKGYYCGACHNGKMLTYEGPVFKACVMPAGANEKAVCDRCHSVGKTVAKKYDFAKFAKDLPKSGLGNGIDWEKAESSGLITPKDFLQGVSLKKQAIFVQKDLSLDAKSSWMGDILFSHKKHTKWNGCEGCHPEIFLGVKKGSTKYNMMQIFNGEYCGVCHRSVAFPLQDCSRCHSKPVQ